MSLLDAIEPTWPPESDFEVGPFKLRNGAGGGKRVSAASLMASIATSADIAAAEKAMDDMGQTPLFSLKPDQDDFDAQLDARGYLKVDATRGYDQNVAALTTTPVPPVTAFDIWEPLAIMEDIWAEGGIGPQRLAVMDRVTAPKTAIFGRIDAKPAGSAFVALHKDVAMLHALEIRQEHRRKGLARWMVIAAAHWAKSQGAAKLGLLVTEANQGANALYRSMGFTAHPGYHYRILEKAQR